MHFWFETTLKSCVTLVCYHISAKQVGMGKEIGVGKQVDVGKQVGVGKEVRVGAIAMPQAPSGFHPDRTSRRKSSRLVHK